MFLDLRAQRYARVAFILGLLALVCVFFVVEDYGRTDEQTTVMEASGVENSPLLLLQRAQNFVQLSTQGTKKNEASIVKQAKAKLEAAAHKVQKAVKDVRKAKKFKKLEKKSKSIRSDQAKLR